VVSRSNIVPYYQGFGAIVSILLIAGLSAAESFSVLKTLTSNPDVKRLLESNRESVQQLARLVFEQFCTRSLAFPLMKSQEFRCKLEASIINWLMTFFGATLGIPELLSMLILTLMDGTRFLAALGIVILEGHFVEWSKSRLVFPRVPETAGR
jgi:Rab-GTPase-TBC domain